MSQWDQLIQAAGQRYNVDPQLIAALVHVESSGNPKAYNASTGATGLGQQIPATAKALGIDPTDPAQSIEGVAKLLNENLNRYGSPEQAVLAYHGGTDQSNWGPKTQDYLRKVTARYGAPAVADTSNSAFEARFGPRPSKSQASAPVAGEDAQAAFSARFGERPEHGATPAQKPAEIDHQEPAAQPQDDSLLGLAGRGLEYLGETGIRNANALGRGISDALDAPAEWLAYGAEKSGLTGALNAAGVPMPTYEGQVQLNKASRAAYDAANPEPGIQGTLSRVAGNIGGVLVPIAGAEAAITQGAQAASRALGNPQALGRAGEFLRGNGGLLSRMTYGAGQGAAGGALLSGGGQESTTGEQAALGAALGAAAPVAGAGLRYIGNAGRALAAPFTESGRAGIAQRALQTEADVVSRAAGGRPVSGGEYTEFVPGSAPTLGQATANPGILALENAAKGRAPAEFGARDMANYQARNAYFDSIRGTAQTLDEAIAAREAATAPLREASLQGAKPANVKPVVDEIDKILSSPAGQEDAVVTALSRVRNKLDLGQKGLQDDVAQLYGVRKSIGNQLRNVAGKDNSEAQFASSELQRVREVLDDAMEKAAPGFANYRQTYAEMSRPIDAQSYLQGLNLTDQTSQRITLAKVKDALTKIDKLRKAPGANEAKSITDDQLAALNNLHRDLQREVGPSAGRVRGSDTVQNLAQNQLIEALLPGRAAAVAPAAPSALGGALGLAIGGPVGAGIGAVGGQQAAGVYSRALSAQAPDIEARLIDYLLNPNGGEILRRSAQPGAANLLLRRSVPVAPSGVTTSGQNN